MLSCVLPRMFALVCVLMYLVVCLRVVRAWSSNVQLQPSAAALQQRFPNSQLGTNTQKNNDMLLIRGVVIRASSESVSQASAAFQASHESFAYLIDYGATNAEVKTKFQTGRYDYMISTAAPTKADLIKSPNLLHVPFNMNAVVPVYNLPSSFTQGNTLMFSGKTLCAIFRGGVRYWNDSAIRADNPLFDYSSLGSSPPAIRVALAIAGSAPHLAFSTYCRKIDAKFAATIAAASAPKYPVANMTAILYKDQDMMNSGVADTPFSVAVATLTNVLVLRLSVAGMLNSLGQPLFATPNTMSLNVNEMGSKGYQAGTLGYDLTNPATTTAWPICTVAYMFIDKQSAIATCAAKRVMLEFFLFFYQSSSVREICESLGSAVLPDVFIESVDLINRLKREVTCLNRELINSQQSAASVVGVGALTQGLMHMFTSFYLAIDTEYQFKVEDASSQSTFDRHAAHELEVGIIDGDLVTDAAVNDPTNDVYLIPAFMAGVAIQFQLPTALVNFYASVGLASGLPPLYPLYLDLDTCAALFLGQVSTWDHPSMLKLNPQLAGWINASNADTAITMVVGSSSLDNVPYASILMFSTFIESDYYSSDAVKPITGNIVSERPFDSIVRSPHIKAPFIYIEIESRLTVKMQATPGSVSYRMISSNQASDITTDFQFIAHFNGQRQVIAPQQSSFTTCGPSFIHMSYEQVNSLSLVDLSSSYARLGAPSTQRRWLSEAQSGCYPLANMYSLSVNLNYSADVKDQCKKGMHALQFAKYVLTSNIFTLCINSLGFFRVTDNPLVRDYANSLLNSATCSGAPLMIVPPVYWQTSGAISVIGYVIGAAGILCAIAGAVVVWSRRTAPIIRAASPPFMILILFGLLCFIASAIPWAIPAVSNATCMTFNWLINVGFTCVYVPLLVKTWRVYKIFSGQKLKVVKITNRHLALVVGLVVAAELIFMLLWSVISPLQALESSGMRNGAMHYHTHCNVESSGGGAVFLAIAACWKGLVVLCSALMAFNTRKIKAEFNESQAIAWSIYNTFFSGVIVIACVVFVNAVEDTLILLLVLFIGWTGLSVFGFLFGSKFRHLLEHEHQQLEMSLSRSNMPLQEYSGGFSFMSVDGMQGRQLAAYVIALKTHLYNAENKLGQQPMASVPYRDTLDHMLPSKQRLKLKERAVSCNSTDNSNPSTQSLCDSVTPELTRKTSPVQVDECTRLQLSPESHSHSHSNSHAALLRNGLSQAALLSNSPNNPLVNNPTNNSSATVTVTASSSPQGLTTLGRIDESLTAQHMPRISLRSPSAVNLKRRTNHQSQFPTMSSRAAQCLNVSSSPVGSPSGSPTCSPTVTPLPLQFPLSLSSSVLVRPQDLVEPSSPIEQHARRNANANATEQSAVTRRITVNAQQSN